MMGFTLRQEESENTQSIENLTIEQEETSPERKNNTELEELKVKREELTREIEKLEQQVQSAKQLLASYDEILNGEKQNSNTQVNRE